MAIPDGFPNMEIPLDNAFTIERWVLGKKLFYDPVLSLDSSISCATCHKLEFAFSDNVPKSFGVNHAPGTRNAPTLTNTGFQPYYTKEGGISTLEQQVLIPIQEHNEMNFNILLAGERIAKNEKYKTMSNKAYSKEPDYYVITRALACFERTIISGDSKYDGYLKNTLNFSQSEANGMNLFFSEETNCFKCHPAPMFTNYDFENNGLYQNYADEGKYRLTLDSVDLALFKIPTLRNVANSGPYMHDGSIETLYEVVNHYNTGGYSHSNKSNLIKTLNLTETQITDLVNFLKTLTDNTFLNNKNLSNE